MGNDEGTAEQETAEIENLRRDFWDKHAAAVKAAYALFAALPVGDDRSKAHEVFEALRTAPLV